MDNVGAIVSVLVFVGVAFLLFQRSKKKSFGIPSKTKDGGGENKEVDSV